MSKQYVTPKEFQEEYTKSLEKGEPTQKLILFFQKIAKGYAPTLGTANKIDTDACINFAVSEAWLKWKKFNSELYSNHFAFFTSMIGNDLKQHYNDLMHGNKNSISIESLFTSAK